MELQIYAFNYVIQLWLATEVLIHICLILPIKYMYLILFIYRLCLKPN